MFQKCTLIDTHNEYINILCVNDDELSLIITHMTHIRHTYANIKLCKRYQYYLLSITFCIHMFVSWW